MIVSVQQLAIRVRDQMIADGYGDDPREINSGNCDAFADRFAREIEAHFPDSLINFGEREICDYFADREECGSPLVLEKLLRELPDMAPPAGMTWDQLNLLIERADMGWGIHVFVVHAGKAYDSESTEGVASFFDLPLYQRILAFLAEKYGPLEALECASHVPGV